LSDKSITITVLPSGVLAFTRYISIRLSYPWVLNLNDRPCWTMLHKCSLHVDFAGDAVYEELVR
jgi:hypothetical protein